MTHVIAGCGYIGERLARRISAAGGMVHCLVRSPERAALLAEAGLTAQRWSLDEPQELLPCCCRNRILFYSVPPPGGGTTDTRSRRFIELLRAAEPPDRIIYLSATSVYSESNGGVVNEESPTEPISAMGKRRLDAEQAFLDYGDKNDVTVIILRISGIYGPGRLPLMQIRSGQPILLESESGPSNRIHADDLVTVCMAAAKSGDAGEIFNVSDGHPSSMTSYFNLCADALGLPRQMQVTMSKAGELMSPLMYSYFTQSRVVDNSRMLDRLKIKLRYESLADGIAASIRCD